MAVRVSLTHRTTYTYERPAKLGPQVIRLRPAPHNRTPVHSYSLRLQPEKHFINWQQDAYGNYLARVVAPEPSLKFEVLVNLIVDLEAYNPFDFFLEPYAEECPFKYNDRDLENLETYVKPDPITPRLKEFLSGFDLTKRRTVDFLVDLNARTFDAVEYVIRMEPGVQTPEETLEKGSGSCRDSAWLFVQACRQLGLAARFVSGYLVQLEPDERPLDGPAGPTKDFTDLHAWAEVYVPGAGWIGLDATSGLLAAEGHIPLACTPRPSSASPVEGMVEDVESEFDFEMRVDRIVDVPRVTKPYPEDVWLEILRRGEEVDKVLKAQKLHLTMGGEPTFVATHNPDDAQWNTEALGDQKLEIADAMSRRLLKVWSPGGLLHHGQGKWYPGEQLPRWAISVVSRSDGEPVWRDVEHFAPAGQDLGHDEDDAKRFVRTLASVLKVPSDGIEPAYEDAWYYLWRERKLPANVDPLDSKLEDKIERDRLARVFRQGLGSVVGWLLPLGHDGTDFASGKWKFREENCFLYPGDSPMGFRLPMDSLNWFDPDDSLTDLPWDPTVKRPPFPRLRELTRGTGGSSSTFEGAPLTFQKSDEGGLPDSSKLQEGESKQSPAFIGPERVRTALCVEPRDGILRVFLPPVESAAAFLELSAAIERTCELTSLPIQLEGYPAPFDARLKVFKVTPDPGVIEMNVPPTSSWGELVKQTETLYQIAKEEGLTAEKFDLDGKHVGSGGGNHVVLGAATPLDSPFLRRPDLLRSLISFWHNHPALSYLFSGQFIGPTSQAPRIDEARNDAVHELERAFSELDRQTDVPPWLVDRALRHILVDVTGNTHRTEFCIDKLYSPDSSTGRLGLVEMRAFEMPPHHRMASAQHLLVRSVLGAFAEQPYRAKLVRWGNNLQDRFLLPHFVKEDLKGALGFLSERGFHLDPDWFEPHYQFRFPYYGEVVKDDIMLEVRGALEPWHVLGEEAGGGGQTRYVDSSLERLQVKMRGGTHGRHVICCNGTLVPLRATGVGDELVGGVRYRAWQPPSCLHPTIGVNVPLRMDIYDTWNEHAIAGCTYHVEHPGGRGNEDRPINAVAAESRRIARFEAAGHEPRSYVPLNPGVNGEFPLTLDLRGNPA